MEHLKVLVGLITLCFAFTAIALFIMAFANDRARKILEEYEDENSEY